ncbi:hypothetical protein OROMI_006025 [Orobanche minor]
MKGNMKSVVLSFVVVVISISAILEPISCAADLSFEVSSATTTSYSKLLRDVRDRVKDPTLKYGGTNIPVMAAPTNPAKYLTIDLSASDGGKITIALSKNDLYVAGYLDKIDTKFRAHFFKDAPSDARNSLFPEATGANRLNMAFKSSYADMEKSAKIADRSKLGLGPLPLNKLINQVYGKKLDVPTEAKFMLVAVQMLAEATRFKYIEDAILQNFRSSYNPNPKAIELEKSWQKITIAIKNSTNGIISPPLNLDGWTVSKVVDIAKDMGLLKNEGR